MIDQIATSRGLSSPFFHYRMVELGFLSREFVEGFLVFVEVKDSSSSGISGLQAMRIVDASMASADSKATLKVVAGEVSCSSYSQYSSLSFITD